MPSIEVEVKKEGSKLKLKSCSSDRRAECSIFALQSCVSDFRKIGRNRFSRLLCIVCRQDGRGRDLGPWRPKLVPAPASIAKKPGGGGRSFVQQGKQASAAVMPHLPANTAGERGRNNARQMCAICSQPPALGGPIPSQGTTHRG